MTAGIESGGKQYTIKSGQKITVDRLNVPANTTVLLPNLLTNETVSITILAHLQGPKVMTRKFRNKTRYHRLKGHRQPVTVLQLQDVPQENKEPAKRQTAKHEEKSA